MPNKVAIMHMFSRPRFYLQKSAILECRQIPQY